MRRLNFTLTVHFDSSEFKRLQEIKTGGGGFLLPQDVELSMVWLEMTPTRAALHLYYFGYKKDGKRHQRRTSDVVYLPLGDDGVGWLNDLFPRGRETSIETKDRMALRDLWPQP